MATNTEKIVVQVVVKGQGELEKLNKGTKKATGGVGALVKQYGLLTAGIAGAVQAFRTINKFVAQSIRTFRDFEFQMAKVKAITGSSTDDFSIELYILALIPPTDLCPFKYMSPAASASLRNFSSRELS